MNLAELAAASERVAGAAGRNEKADQLADVLRRIDRTEIPFAVASLSGRTRQGRIGAGTGRIYLLRRNLLAAGAIRARDCRERTGDARLNSAFFLTIVQDCKRVVVTTHAHL